MNDSDNIARHEIALALALRKSVDSKLSAGVTYNLYKLFLNDIANEAPLDPKDYEGTANDYISRVQANKNKAFLNK